MASMFTGLYIASSGLNAYHQALNTTAHNAANADTEGYCRQYTVRTAADALKLSSRDGMQGMGVNTTGVEQYRNEFYDYQYWNNNKKLGEAEIHEYYMYQIENYYKGSTVADTDNASAADDFVSIFDTFHSTLEELKKQNGTLETRNSVISQGQTVAKYFNDLYANMQNLQSEANLEIKDLVSRINAVSEQICVLNREINTIEMNCGTANDLRDQRALLIDELSKYIPTTVKEADVVDSNNPEHYTGATTYEVRIAGMVLVSTFEFNTIELTPRSSDQKVNQCDAEGLYDLSWSNGNSFNTNNASMGGQLKALFDIRDGDNNENFTGTIAEADVATKTIKITDSSVQDVYSLNIPQNGTIKVGASYMEYDSFEVTVNSEGEYEYTFHLDDSAKIPDADSLLVGRSVSVGSGRDYMGVPYYMSQMNQFLRKYTEEFNSIYEGNDDLNGDPSGNFFTCENVVSGLEQHMSTFTGGYSSEFGYCDGQAENTSYYLMTAENIMVATDLVKDPSRLSTTTDIDNGVDQYDIIDRLINLSDQKNLYRGSSPREFLQCILTDITMDMNRASTLAANYDNIVNTIDTKRLSVSAVDKDEEAVDLVKFQNAYNLCARMVTTMTELYDRLILETGV